MNTIRATVCDVFDKNNKKRENSATQSKGFLLLSPSSRHLLPAQRLNMCFEKMLCIENDKIELILTKTDGHVALL